jgi:hypothetical protein
MKLKIPKMRQQVERVALKPLPPEHNKQPTVTTVKPSAPTVGGNYGAPMSGIPTGGRVAGDY